MMQNQQNPHNLSPQFYPLVGRSAELAALGALLRQDDVRQVTISGPAGAGKTRLAVQLVAELLPEFADGGFVVALAPLHDPALVAAAIARALGLKSAASQSGVEGLAEHLGDLRMLLVLDTFEHLVAATPIIGQLLTAAPALKIVVTSRVPLHLPDEQIFALPALAEEEAIELFAVRAKEANPGFVLTPPNRAAVATISARLDRLPLALELAAARVRQFDPRQILARLDDPAGAGSLPLLTSGGAHLPARQQTIRAAIGWSYNLLTPAEQTLLTRLAVFAGGATARTAAEVVRSAGVAAAGRQETSEQDTSSMLRSLEQLRDQNLLRETTDPDGVRRFRMLRTVREYAADELAASGEAEAWQRHHADYYLALAERLAPDLHGPGQVAALEMLEAEHGNLRAAWSTLFDAGMLEEAGRLATAIWPFWRLHGHWAEGLRLIESVLAKSDGQEAAPGSGVWRAGLLHAAGDISSLLGDFASARRLLSESVLLLREAGDKGMLGRALTALGEVIRAQKGSAAAIPVLKEAVESAKSAGDSWGEGIARYILGIVTANQGDAPAALELYESSRTCLETAGDSWGQALVLGILGYVGLHTDLPPEQVAPADLEQARRDNEASLELYRRLGDHEGIAAALRHLGHAAEIAGEGTAAVDLYTDSLGHLRALGHKPAVAMTLHNLGYLLLGLDEDDLAAACFTESLAFDRRADNPHEIGRSLAGLAAVAAGRGQGEQAALIYGAALNMLELRPEQWFPPHLAIYRRRYSAARTLISDDAWATGLAQGAVLTREEAIAAAGSVAAV